MSITTDKNGRLCNQIIRNLSLSLIAKKHDLYIQYSSHNRIKRLGIKLFIGNKKYNDTLLVDNNNYFNILSKNFVQDNFDKDYWGLSNYQSIKHIINTDERNEIKIATMSFADLYLSFLRFNEIDKKRIKIVHVHDEADYIIDNYMKRIGTNYKINPDIFVKFYEIKVDNIGKFILI